MPAVVDIGRIKKDANSGFHLCRTGEKLTHILSSVLSSLSFVQQKDLLRMAF